MLAVVVLALTGCPAARPAPSQPPPPSPVRTATVEAEQRALAEARAHFEGRRYGNAARLLRHYLELHAHTSNAVDARWLLGRSYEELGEWHAALAQYRIIANEATRAPGLTPAMNTQVRDRMSYLTRTLGRAAPTSSGFVAIALDPANLPDPARWQQWLTPLLAEGITTLVIDVAPVIRLNPATAAPAGGGVYFQTTWAKLERDLFGDLIPLAHDLGLTVFASLDLTQLPWLDPTLGWTTYIMDEKSKQLTPSLSFDLLHPAVQEYLSGFLADLARTQIDGMIALLGGRTGPRSHMSAKGLAQFAQTSGQELDPERMLTLARGLAPARVGQPAAAGDPLAPTFWRWAGWQARERLNVLARLRTVMRQQRTGFQIAVAVHDVTLSNPTAGLFEFGEDLLEVLQRGFTVALPLASLSPLSLGGEAAPGGGSFTDQVGRVLELAGSAERVWLVEPAAHLDRASLSRLLKTPQAHYLRSRGLNLVITSPTP